MGLFGLFRKESKRTFEPPPPLAPTQRDAEGRIIDPQSQSAFITKLPPEIRNRIYKLAFEDDRPLQSYTGPISLERQQRDRSAQTPSLHLLLTCRLINKEATVLAFSTYTFTPSNLLTQYLFHHNAMRHLLPTQFAVLSRIALDRSDNYFEWYQCRHASDVISAILLLFPGIKSVELRCQRGGRGFYSTQSYIHYAFFTAELPTPGDHLPVSQREKKKKGEMSVERLLARHIPRWFQMIICDVMKGRSEHVSTVKWEQAPGWRVAFPQVKLLRQDDGDRDVALAVAGHEQDDEGRNLIVRAGGVREEQQMSFVPTRDAERYLTMSNDHAIWERSTTTPSTSQSGQSRHGPLPALVLCNCGLPTLTQAQLLQDTTGRSVDITVVYYASKLEQEAMKRTKEENDRYYYLKAGAERLPVVEVGGGRALRWDGEEAFWEGLRRKNEEGRRKNEGWLRRKNEVGRSRGHGWLEKVSRGVRGGRGLGMRRRRGGTAMRHGFLQAN
jgi:hypothetical protein